MKTKALLNSTAIIQEAPSAIALLADKTEKRVAP